MKEHINPWTILGQKEVYDNKWIKLTEYDVLNPSGGKGIYGKVHFKNYAIGIIPLDEHLNTYLVGQYRFVLDQYSWEIPEGGGPIGIDILESAQRELKEETGLVAGEWTKLMDLHLSNSVSDEYGSIYLARDLRQEDASPEETEDLMVKKVPFEEAYQMVEQGIITDALAVTAIMKVKILLLEGKLK
ncbi:NUDIX hydrolase [Chitinophagaceae bacterium LB-8]|jgi:8-oxo-dGTP pyrophosphatase MutT (NUDIX family)|uniref:GDP-mannose pyrophosphatase n=1 Tax=Paraflavisolibacter caeni TaxID=2982496 RepID=A0A9X2XXV0_9BACT|nr:NUDIX hydrolase [Paraflavisolibacter caeni]MCU7550756.1 NUDIX hydrolase [Paraflavisolibacter caeni]